MMGTVTSRVSGDVKLSDYIGYKVHFTEAINHEITMTIVRDMTRLNIGPVRTNLRKKSSPFAPYSAATRRSQKSQSSKSEGSIADRTDVEQNSPQSPWGKLLSITKGFPDISLFVASTGVGEIVDVVDVATGERETTSSKSLFSGAG